MILTITKVGLQMLQNIVPIIFFFGMLLAHWLAQTLIQWLPTKAKQYGTPKLYHVEIIKEDFFNGII
jgi:hypothetical protein